MTGEEISEVLAHYDLGELQAGRRVQHGHVDENWVIDTTTGRYFLKCRHPRRREPNLIQAQHALMEYLRSVHFPAPAIVSPRQGETFLRLQAEIYEIHEYIPGELCDIRRPEHLAEAARTLAWYHTVVEAFDHQSLRWPGQRYSPDTLWQIIDGLAEAWQGRTTSEIDSMLQKLRTHAEDLSARFSELGELPGLVVHGDYYADNLIFQGDVVAGVVDYDLAHWCWRVTEVAEALIYFTAERPGRMKHIVYPGVLDLDAVRRFLAAYAEKIGLQAVEIRALPQLIRTIWLCAALDPPLAPGLSVEVAPHALPEILALAGWARMHTPEMEEIGLTAVRTAGQGSRTE